MSSRRVLLMLVVMLTLGVSRVHGEPQGGEGYWRFSPLGQHHNSIVRVTVDKAVATGVLVRVNRDKPAKGGYEGYVLTAAHVFDFDRETRGIKVTYPNGRRSKDCKPRYLDKDNDLALLWVWVPEQTVPAEFAHDQATRGDALEFSGLGGGVKLTSLRNFQAVASDPTDDNMIYADVSLLPGDSGGPIFKDGKLVGIISGGWFWWDDQRRRSPEVTRQITWPARAANLGAIQSLLGRLDDAGAEVLASTELVPPR
ncbi:MAG: serine protease [Planctomycetota bacterium]